MIDQVISSVFGLIDAYLADSLGSLFAYVCLLGSVLALFQLFRRGSGG